MDILGTIISVTSPIVSFAMANQLVLITLLVIFIVIAMRLFFLFKESIFVAIISALFPVVLIKVFNMPFDLTLNLVLIFAIAGVALLLLYRIFETLWVGTKVFSIPFKLLFKALTNKYVLIILLLALLAGIFMFYKPRSINMATMPELSYICSSDDDCAFANIGCCRKAGFGQAMSKLSALSITEYNNKNCDTSNCSIQESPNALEKSSGIITVANPMPKAVCINSTCAPDLELIGCMKFCQAIGSGSESEAAIKFTLDYTGVSIDKLAQKCGC